MGPFEIAGKMGQLLVAKIIRNHFHTMSLFEPVIGCMQPNLGEPSNYREVKLSRKMALESPEGNLTKVGKLLRFEFSLKGKLLPRRRVRV